MTSTTENTMTAPVSPSITLTMLHDRVLIRRRPPAEKIQNGIVLLATDVPDAPNSGYVVAAGPGRVIRMCECGAGIRDVMKVAPGDLVLYGRYAGHEVTIDAETFVIVQQEEILSVIATAQQLELAPLADVLADALFADALADRVPYAPVSDSDSHVTAPEATDVAPAGSVDAGLRAAADAGFLGDYMSHQAPNFANTAVGDQQPPAGATPALPKQENYPDAE